MSDEQQEQPKEQSRRPETIPSMTITLNPRPTDKDIDDFLGMFRNEIIGKLRASGKPVRFNLRIHERTDEEESARNAARAKAALSKQFDGGARAQP